jgi:hypothetical protein
VSPAVFGDFLAAANHRLDNAVLDGDQPPVLIPPITRSLRRLIVAIERHCDDLAPCDEIQVLSRS